VRPLEGTCGLDKRMGPEKGYSMSNRLGRPLIDGPTHAAISKASITLGQEAVSRMLRKYRSAYQFLRAARLRDGVLVGEFGKMQRPYSKSDCGHMTGYDTLVCVSQLAHVFMCLILENKLSPVVADLSPAEFAIADEESRVVLTQFKCSFHSRVQDDRRRAIRMTLDRIRAINHDVVVRMSFSLDNAIFGQMESFILRGKGVRYAT